MAKHQRITRRSKKLAALGVATATATALTVGAAPPLEADAAKINNADVDLLAGIQFWPEPGDIPDLTFGLGSAVYDFSQLIAAQVETAIVENISLVALAQAMGLDPESLLNNLLNTFAIQDVLELVVDEVLNELPMELGLGTPVGDLLGGLLDPAVALLVNLLNDLTEAVPVGDLLRLLGIDLSEPLNLSELIDLPGLNVVTTGSAFSLLKMIGLDLGWAPSLPNSIADEINGTDYLTLGVEGLVEALDGIGIGDLPLVEQILGLLAPVTGLLPDALSLRAPIVLGFGMGAFAAGAAYEQVVADLPNQPGGANWDSTLDPLLGSITILPMVLLRNPGRANGGLLARMYPLAGLFGINTVTPETQAENSGGGIPVLNTGLAIGGANLLPIKIDATVEYDIMSDFAAWPNPFSLANNLAAGLFPTYILRGLSVLDTADSLIEQVSPQLARILDNALGNEPLAINLYLTLPMNTLPLLEPLYLATDFINLFTPGFDFNNPIATALNPVLTSLVNLGYTDVFWDEDTGQYDRTLTEAHIPTGFGTLPDINWFDVPGNLFTSMMRGVQDAFEEGLTAPKGTNALRALLSLLGLDLDGLGSGTASLGLDTLPDLLTDAIEDIVGDLGEISPLSADGPEAAAVPNVNAETLTINTSNRLDEGSELKDVQDEGVDTSTEAPADEDGDAVGGDTEQLTPDVPSDSTANGPSSKVRTSAGNGRTEVRTGPSDTAERLQQTPVGQRLQDRTNKINERIQDTRSTIRNGFGVGKAPASPAKAGAGATKASASESGSESGGDE
ncbi:ATPase [Mycolicibacterium thermoresistibile]